MYRSISAELSRSSFNACPQPLPPSMTLSSTAYIRVLQVEHLEANKCQNLYEATLWHSKSPLFVLFRKTRFHPNLKLPFKFLTPQPNFHHFFVLKFYTFHSQSLFLSWDQFFVEKGTRRNLRSDQGNAMWVYNGTQGLSLCWPFSFTNFPAWSMLVLKMPQECAIRLFQFSYSVRLLYRQLFVS